MRDPLTCLRNLTLTTNELCRSFAPNYGFRHVRTYTLGFAVLAAPWGEFCLEIQMASSQ